MIGATANPSAPDPDAELARMREKMLAGADFFQTQLTYRPELVRAFLDRLRGSDLPAWPRMLVGVGPFKHLRMAVHIRDRVWGADVPDALVQRMARARDEAEEGKRICVEVIEALREVDGVAGCHVMAVAWEESVPEILERAGLAPHAR